MKKFAPFADGEISFPAVEGSKDMAEVHLFTGENGTGKTRILAALMASLGNINPLQDRVRQDSGTELEVQERMPIQRSLLSDGSWRFKDGSDAGSSQNFSLREKPAFALAGSGIALLEDRSVAPGAEVKPARADESLTLIGPVGGTSILQRLMNLRMRVALERDGRRDGSDGRLTACLVHLEKAISVISGREFSLHVQSERGIRLMAQWGDVTLYFSELPDGLRSLLNWLAGWVVLQIEQFEDSARPLDEPVILILDEPENHLHPEWQRRVLPAVQKLFPNAQMFVVTHSPFVVCSLNEGWIHKFSRGTDGLVRVAPPMQASKGDTYIDAVEDVLGLIPIKRFDTESQKLLEKFTALIRKVQLGDAVSEDLDEIVKDLKIRGGEVARIVDTELYQLEPSRVAEE